MRISPVIVLTLTLACTTDADDGEAEPDASARVVDAGARTIADLGAPPDAAPDASAAEDAGVAGDTGAEPDAAAQSDAAPDMGGPPRPPAPGCDDGEDNDGDDLYDLADPDCSSPADPNEGGGNPVVACFNGADDDQDGLIDFPDDPGCRAAGDEDEVDGPLPACDDGRDNDEDGVTDYPNDPGCQGRGDGDELDPPITPACANGEDDDGNGRTDHPDDPGCSSAADRVEGSPCGAPTLIDLNAHLEVNASYVGDLSGVPSHLVGVCGGAAGGELVFAYRVEQVLDRLVFSTRHPQTVAPVVMYLRRDCLGPDALCDRGADADPGVTLALEHVAPGLYFLVVDTGSREAAGRFELTVDAIAPPQCRNGVDDDDDGRVDVADPGCVEADDADEADPPEAPACFDGEDNDGDGAVDYPNDPDCLAAGGPREAPLCALDAPILRFGQAGGEADVPEAQGPGLSQGSCNPPLGPEVVLAIDLDEPSDVHVVVTQNGQPAQNVGLYARSTCDDREAELGCRANGGELRLRALDRGWVYVVLERGPVPAVPPLAVTVVVESNLRECNDEVDNDNDGAIDLADLGCVEGRDDDEGDDPPGVTACADGVDNDGDGATDWPADDGCSGAGDDDEEPACVGRLVGGECFGCSDEAEHQLEIAPGLWACVNAQNIVTYQENDAMCAEGHTPATFDLVNANMLRIPSAEEDAEFFRWYQALPVNGDTRYIRTGQKRRGGCQPEEHGDLYIRQGVGPDRPGDGWHDLFNGGGSCELPTGSANNMSHALVGVVCVEGEYALPRR